MKFLIRLLLVVILFGVGWRVYTSSSVDTIKDDNSPSSFSGITASLFGKTLQIEDIEKEEKQLKQKLSSLQKQLENGEIDTELAKQEAKEIGLKLKELAENNENIPTEKIAEQYKIFDENFNITENKESILNAFDTLKNMDISTTTSE